MVFQNSPNIFVAIVQIKLYGCQATGHTGLIKCQRTCVKLVQVNTSHQHRHPITLLMTKLVAGSRLGCNSREAAIWTLCEMLWKALFGWWKRAGFDGMWTKLRLLASHKNLGLLISFLLGSISTFADNSTRLVGTWSPSTKLSRLHWPSLSAPSAVQSAAWSFCLGVPHFTSMPLVSGVSAIKTPFYTWKFSLRLTSYELLSVSWSISWPPAGQVQYLSSW